MSTCPRCGAELPASQANSVDVIAATVLAVDEGANTCALIAEALGYVYGQGVYYGNAAEELGFTTKVQEVPHLWALTTDGEEFLAADRLLRVDILTKKILSNPNVQRVAAGLPIECGACTGTTVEQRTGSYEAWLAFAERPFYERRQMLDRAVGDVRERAPEVVRRNREMHQPSSRPACTSCWLPIPIGCTTCPHCS